MLWVTGTNRWAGFALCMKAAFSTVFFRPFHPICGSWNHFSGEWPAFKENRRLIVITLSEGKHCFVCRCVLGPNIKCTSYCNSCQKNGKTLSLGQELCYPLALALPPVSKKVEFICEMRILIPVSYFVRTERERNVCIYHSLWPMLHASAVHWSLVFLFVFLNFLKILFVYFWLHWIFVAAHRLFSSCGEWELLFVAVHGLLIAVASLVAEHGF